MPIQAHSSVPSALMYSGCYRIAKIMTREQRSMEGTSLLIARIARTMSSAFQRGVMVVCMSVVESETMVYLVVS